MPLDPRIPMGITVPQIPVPDFGQTLLTGQNILAQQALQQQRMVTLAQLLEDRKQQLAAQTFLQDYWRQRQAAQPRQPSPLAPQAGGLSPEMAGTAALTAASGTPSFPPGAFDAGTDLSQEAAPVGMTPQPMSSIPAVTQQPVSVPLPSTAPRTLATSQGQAVAVPGTPAPTPAEQPVAAPGTPPMTPPALQGQPFPSYLEMAARFGKQGEDIYGRYQAAMSKEADMQKDLVNTYMPQIQYTSMVLAAPRNEEQYQQTLADLRQKVPQMVGMLPEHYDATTVNQVQKTLHDAMIKGTALSQRLGMTPIMLRHGTETAVGRMTPGGLEVLQVPEGYQVTGTTHTVNTGDAIEIRDATGQVLDRQPINKFTPAWQTAMGKGSAEWAATAPQRYGTSTTAMQTLDRQSGIMQDNIQRVVQLMKSANLPATGIVGQALKNLPGSTQNDINQLLSTIKSNLGYEALANLKKVGGTMGQVSNFEERILQSLQGALEMNMTTETFLYELMRVSDNLKETRQQRHEAFDEEFGDYIRSGGTRASPGPGQTQPVPPRPAGQSQRQGTPGGQGTSADTKPVSRAIAQQAFDAENATRQAAGTPPLTWDEHLRNLANHHWVIRD